MKMNLLPYLLSPLLLLAFEVRAAPDKASVYGEIKDGQSAASEAESSETLKKLLSIKGVDAEYQKCKSNGTTIEKIPGCIWGALNDDLKKQVQQMYAQESVADEPGRAPASTDDGGKLTNKSKNLKVDYMSDPAVVELSKVMQKKLEEALVGDEDAQKDRTKIAAVDHAKYIELYRTELGKTIVNAFTSYCVESDTKASEKLHVKSCKDTNNPIGACPLFIVPEDEKTRKAKIEDNLKSLKGANFESSTKAANNADSDKWSRCIASVANVCYTDSSEFSGSLAPADISYSKKRACIIIDYVKSARKNLIIVNEQKKYYEDLPQTMALDIGNSRQVKMTEKNSIDVVTTVTSKDVEDSFQKKNEDLKKEMDKCLDANDQITDPEACKKFLSTDAKAKELALTEFGIRQFALEAKIDEKFNDKAEVEKYLLEEGYDKSKIAEMIKGNDIETVKAEIKARYKAERDAIIATMADKIKSKTSKDDGKIDQTDQGRDQQNLKKIREELSSRSDDLKQLVHFNNVVSSYLEITKTDGTKIRNVASLFVEIKDGAKNFRDIDKDQSKEIEEKAKKAGLTSEKSGSSTELSVENLNSIFKYSTEK